MFMVAYTGALGILPSFTRPLPSIEVKKNADPLTMYLTDAYTIPAPLAGIPGLSVPCGFSDNMPVGLQILGPYMGEDIILDVGEVYELASEWYKEKPELESSRKSHESSSGRSQE